MYMYMQSCACTGNFTFGMMESVVYTPPCRRIPFPSLLYTLHLIPHILHSTLLNSTTHHFTTYIHPTYTMYPPHITPPHPSPTPTLHSSIQTFMSILFLYVAFVAPAVAFGGLMEEVTGNQIGETETLLMTGMAGVFYGLASCQPLTILAFTGPLLLFEEVVFAVSSIPAV